MQLVFFTHPSFLNSQSMPRFANMLSDGMQERGHTVELWSPRAFFAKLPSPIFIKKWLGYIDQYVVFPSSVRKKIKNAPPHTLFIFTDQALGPWVLLVKNKPHVIHCHDFLAQRSALGAIPQNPTGWSGKLYQAYIRRGYRQGKNFISVSQKTKEDLRRFLLKEPLLSEVVYNGMNQTIVQLDAAMARKKLSEITGLDLSRGFLLHIGGNQWYKNRCGVMLIYGAWRLRTKDHLSLLLIGSSPDAELKEEWQQSPYREDIYFLSGKDDAFVQLAYSGARLLLFPSLAEGFGWPIAEAMAAGCPVVTTREAPMTEIGGDITFYIPKMPFLKEAQEEWCAESASVVEGVVQLDADSKREIALRGKQWVREHFSTEGSLNKIESIYFNLLKSE